MASIWWDLSRHIGVFYFFRGYEELITMDEYRKMNHLIWTKYPVSQKA